MPLSVAQIRSHSPGIDQLKEASQTLEYVLRSIDGQAAGGSLSELLSLHSSLFGEKLKDLFWAIDLRDTLQQGALLSPQEAQIRKAVKLVVWGILKVVPQIDEPLAAKIIGEVDATNQAAVAMAAVKRSEGTSANSISGARRLPAGSRQLERLCRRVGTSLRAGVDMRQIWEQEANRSLGRHQAAIQVLHEGVMQGETMAAAMRQTGGYFPQFTCDLVDVGEQSGRVEETLLQLADHYKHLLSLRRSFLMGIAWPMLQLCAAVGIISLFILVMGFLADTGLFGLSGVSGAIIFAGTFVLLALLVGGVIFAIQAGLFGTVPLRLMMRLPLVGGAMRNMALARLTWAFSIALNAGIDAQRSARLALQSTHNLHFQRHQASIDDAIGRGEMFHEAFGATRAFPREFVDRLESAELSGTHNESLIQMSEEYRQKAQDASKLLTMFASFAIWGLVAVLLAGMVIYMFYTILVAPLYEAMEPI